MPPIRPLPTDGRAIFGSVCLGLVLMLAACAGGTDAGGSSGAPRFPRVTDVPERPVGLPTEEQLAERRRRLEADRESARGADPDAAPVSPVPEPLPELTETMQDLPVARSDPGLVTSARPGVSVQVATVVFRAGSDDLDEQMIDVLSQVAREQQSVGGGIRVIGQGAAGASEELALRQVAAIGQTLIRMGVPPTRIDTELGASRGGGETDHGRAVIYLDY